jgi:vanillate O-demethylase monooxygenase subunit
VPGQTTIPPNARVRSYPVVEKNRWIWIWMGDPALADPAKIEDFHWIGDPEWGADGELLHLKGNYILLVENLLDLSHLTFVHPTTLGTDAIAETPMKSERSGDRVKVTRWIMDKPAPPFFVRAGGFTQNVDRWQIIEFAPPAFVKLDVGGAIAGSGAEKGDRSKGITMRNLNAITPETETTTHYFWAQAHNFQTRDPSITRLLVDQVHTAFMEDLHIIGLQQENIETRPDAVRVDINHDAGGIQARRIVESLIAAERAQRGAAVAAE